MALVDRRVLLSVSGMSRIIGSGSRPAGNVKSGDAASCGGMALVVPSAWKSETRRWVFRPALPFPALVDDARTGNFKKITAFFLSIPLRSLPRWRRLIAMAEAGRRKHRSGLGKRGTVAPLF